VTEPDWLRANRANWDERVGIHLNAPKMYNRGQLRAKQARPDLIVAEVLGAVDGLNVLHLQCHFGMDTLMLAQLGTRIVGLDFSPKAIEAADALTAELDLNGNARFVVSNVYDATAALPEPASFDRVLVSWGALCWLPDMVEWAKVVAWFLKPGGWLALADAHPAAYVFDDATPGVEGRPGFFVPYLGRTPLIEDRIEDYADPSAKLDNTRTHAWLHPIGDIVNALICAGLRLDVLHEHDSVRWKMFECLVSDDERSWRWPDKPWIPLSFSLRASKPE
jgi:SAM-dependent methyltransferase